MHVGSGLPTHLNVLTQELLHGFYENLEQTHTIGDQPKFVPFQIHIAHNTVPTDT
jgi:hypothetical protein